MSRASIYKVCGICFMDYKILIPISLTLTDVDTGALTNEYESDYICLKCLKEELKNV